MSWLTNFFSSMISLFSSPQATQAAQNIEAVVETVAEAIVCEISAASGLAASVMQQVNADSSTIGTTQKIYTASTLICSAIKGTATGATAANVPAITSVSAAS